MNSSAINSSARDFLPETVRFWLLVITNVPSIICSGGLLWVLFSDRALRNALHNHIVIILLLVNLVSQFIDNIAYLLFLRLGVVWPPTPAMCIAWMLAAYQFYVTSTLLVALGSIQRHMLIFHHRCLATSRRRFLLHYFPITLLLFYCLSYGIALATLMIVDHYPYDYTARMCGGLSQWIQNYPTLSIYDVIVNELLPAPVIGVFSVALLIRVLRRKRRLLGRIEWPKQRKMTIQLLSVSTLFCAINLPPILIYVTETLVGKKHLPGVDIAYTCFSYLTYYQSVLLPFVCLPPLWKNYKKMLRQIFPYHLRAWTQFCSFRVHPTNWGWIFYGSIKSEIPLIENAVDRIYS